MELNGTVMFGKEHNVKSGKLKVIAGILGAAIILLTLSGCMTIRTATKSIDFASIISDTSVPHLLIDVRSPEEFSSGHIPSSINIPLADISLNMPKLEPNEIVLTYCNTGIMASSAADKLKSAGYTNVASGSIREWKGQLETGSPIK